MSQKEGETDYKYEDYASEMATYRNPQADTLVGTQMKITLDSGMAFNLNFMKTTGKFFAIGDDGNIANTPAAALITKLSMAFYPLDAQPL